MEIVPNDEMLMASVKVDARNVGYLLPGQMADVSISGFDVSRYGSLEWVSATSHADEQGRVFYEARVALENTELNYAQDSRRVIPMMSEQASINTGAQSLFSLLVRPVSASLCLAFAKR